MMYKLLISFVLASVSAFGCASTEQHETLEIMDMKILLNTSQCTINSGSQNLSTGTEANCFFIKENNSSKIRTKYYKDIDSHVALIVGNSLPKNREYPLTMQRDDCGSTIKALIINKNGVKITEKEFTKTVTCAGVGSDEKEFYILSH
ncbi:hypothetical protein [Thalassomonas haliotis]|uniref:Lipoprotein n=1 Tax=Thalassomonas haliotis TaxID=485448 RepID=A0ABY7V8X8_9GAMM|nr:hypothetical protein [Thalassomonas haliotis]WDE10016.1 hypothetical protein H3N35_17120 [Thalassomonas haliotis]